MRTTDPHAFHTWSLLGLLFWRHQYRYPASKWFGHIAGRLYFRKVWVPPPVPRA